MAYEFHKGINTLARRDKKFNLLVNQLGFIEKKNRTLNFEALLKIIINQQLSNKVANIIFSRLKELVLTSETITPASILELESNKIREVGISFAKIDFIKNLAKEFTKNPEFINKWIKLDDDNAKIEIEKLKGFGQWSSNIILLFYLGRQDVFPVGDATLAKAYSCIYKRKLDSKLIEIKWAVPFRSILALYFWKWVDNGMIDLPDF